MKLLRIRPIVVISILLSANLITLPCLGQSLNLSAEKARLGEIHYSARVGGTVPTEGDTFLVRVLAEGDILRQLQVGVNRDVNFRVVQALLMVVEDSKGEIQELTIGNADSEWEERVEVPEGAELVGISGASGWWIDQIRFHFSDGSTSPTFGGTGGDTDFRLVLSQREGKRKGRWLGFWGTRTNYLESLGLIFWPIE
jgi:hypothetical protein